jgi:hypothetical protein
LKRKLMLMAAILLATAWIPRDGTASEDEGRLKLGGSMRGRYELFRFSEDETGAKKDTRGRIRYRLRLDGKVNLNPRAKFRFRLVSGNDSRSGNQTLGDPVDFGPNHIAIREAMMVLTPWAKGLLPDDRGHWAFHFGRVANPFYWKNGQDKMLWDNDIALAGLSTVFDHQLAEAAKVSINAGYYQIDENSSGRDPEMGAAQLRLEGGGESVTAGIKGSFYYFHDLDSLFVQRGVDGTGGVTRAGGNVPDGMTGSVYGGKMQVVGTQAYVKAKAGSVPMVLYGGYSDNLSADPSQIYEGVGKESVAYNFGLEGGEKKKSIKLGAAWYHIEANAFPSQFIDSDYLDGHTNRQGLFVYLSRTVMKNTDFNVQAFNSDAIETGPDGLNDSVKDSERFRLQVDLLYSF